MGILKGQKRERKGQENFKEIITENFPHSIKNIHLLIWETQWISNRINARDRQTQHSKTAGRLEKNVESSKTKMTLNLQENPNKIGS